MASSMLMPEMVKGLLLPALAVAVPVAAWLAPWWLRIVSGLTLETPEVASLPLKRTVTGLLYQPAPFGDVVAAPLRAGGVLSSSIVTVLADSTLPALSVAK